MADTKRAQLMDAFDTRMKAILVAGGYNTNLGLNAFAWRTTDFAESELPGMNYRDAENDRSGRSSISNQRNLLTIEMEIYPAPGKDSVDDAYDLIQDVFTAIAVDDRWGGLADDTEPGRDNLDIEQHDKIIAKITLLITVEYRSEKWTF